MMNSIAVNEIHWVSGNDFVANQTKQIEREFKRSRPTPRNRRMGLYGQDEPRHKSILGFTYSDGNIHYSF